MRWFHRKAEQVPVEDMAPEVAKVYNTKLDEIKITAQFAATRPGKRKLEGKLNAYKTTGQFQNPCVLVRDNTLIDGYCTYVLAKRLGLATVPCIYVGDEWRPVEVPAQDSDQHTGDNVSQ